MKGLLIKDLYMTMKYCRSYLLMAAVFIAMSFWGNGSLFFLMYPCLLAGMIPMSLLAYDERSHWTQYSETLPYTKSQLVSCKYLTGLAVQFGVMILCGAGYAVREGMQGTFRMPEFAILVLTMFMVSAVAPSIGLPLAFKLGVEKGRIGYIIMIGVICALSIVATGMFEDGISPEVLSSDASLIMPVICIAVIGLYCLSWRLSIVFYKRREV